ncbi:MAG TPA: hypothetical protein EYN06_08395 [Myxococcales bacterium]|nr:hypothetical protein [Myxococcales bacterium]HIN86486.1 hypothetical protein [Myxococcales bacterium]
MMNIFMETKTNFELRFASVESLREVFDRELTHGGVFIESEMKTAVFSEVAVSCYLPDGAKMRVVGQVVNQRENGFFVQFSVGAELDTMVAAIKYLLALSEANSGGEDEESASPPGSASNIARPAWELIDMTSDVPLYKQLSQLSTREKIKLAKLANHPVRRILIRDAEKRIHMSIVQNPKISDVEMIEFTGIATISPGAIRWISTQVKYMKLPQIIQNLVSNPMTPTDLALKLLSKLSTSQLQRLSRSHGIRESIARAAKKKLANRSNN